jgi:hypothetical protein
LPAVGHDVASLDLQLMGQQLHSESRNLIGIRLGAERIAEL